jgi:hypothetical protein
MICNISPSFTLRVPGALAAFKNRLRDSEKASVRWLGKNCVIAAWLGLALAIATPPHGTGFSVCWFKNCTGLPCPGCGLTRSLSCGLHGMFLESLHYHPMGLLILFLLITIALVSLLPVILKQRLGDYIASRALAFNSAYLAFVFGFIIFGIGRLMASLGSALAPVSF